MQKSYQLLGGAIASRGGAVVKTAEWTELRRFSAVSQRLCCANSMIRSGATDRAMCVLARMTSVVNGKLFKLLLAVALAVAIIVYLLSSHGFGDRQPVSYVAVQVATGDTVWQIAARHVVATEDIREMIFAIRQANKLNKNAEIYPGQILHVPVAGKSRAASVN